ncbi:Uma2 family endonuclease [Kitasatospora sp. NPDC088264]|uniref:Uma2 family endonuclease n=1 Tax=Kitasatospora sp. NPDC088264 TaxID=3155296 RepID=UPI00341EAD04
MSELPDWMYAPRDEGWFADDLDHLPQAPRHTELIDGALVFVMSPQRWWHGEVVDNLKMALIPQVPEGVRVGREMSIKLDRRNRPEPDVLVVKANFERKRTQFTPDEVLLVIEVVSPESVDRDRFVKVRKYAEAGIPHYWIVEEEEGGRPAVHVYELDQATSAYVPAGIFRESLERPVPFPIMIDLNALAD